MVADRLAGPGARRDHGLGAALDHQHTLSLLMINPTFIIHYVKYHVSLSLQNKKPIKLHALQSLQN